jgi:hypothetical protein
MQYTWGPLAATPSAVLFHPSWGLHATPLQAALVAAREEAQAARSAGTEGQEGALSSLREQLQAARDRAAQLDQELARVGGGVEEGGEAMGCEASFLQQQLLG